MHFMAESATMGRAVKRQRTERLISRCAQQLTEERGLDGFTMDELAERAEVSRRTLFNYFPSKLDAVLGPAPALSDEARERFLAGGPHGRLVDDLAALADDVLAAHDVDREDFERAKRVVIGEPRLVVIAHERFESHLTAFTDLILEREGDRIPATSARLLMRLMVTLFECSMAAFIAGDDRPFPDLFDESLRTARELLA